MTLSNLELMKYVINGTLPKNINVPIHFPPPIMKTMGMQLIDITSEPGAAIEMDPTLEMFANPLGTMHGGIPSTLGDTAIGIAHWSSLKEGETFTSVDLRVNFFRPLFGGKIRATSQAINYGKTLSYYNCNIIHLDSNKLIATVTSTVITLRGDAAKGR
jgi:uncharacterized protein (TIGR00369 family)